MSDELKERAEKSARNEMYGVADEHDAHVNGYIAGAKSILDGQGWVSVETIKQVIQQQIKEAELNEAKFTKFSEQATVYRSQAQQCNLILSKLGISALYLTHPAAKMNEE